MAQNLDINIIKASSSSDDSRAPENFQISTSNSSDNHLNSYSYKLKCPLCATFRKNFYCKNCVRNGEFVHSTHHLTEKLSEKQQKYLNLQASLKKCNDRCNQLLSKWKICENLKLLIKQKQEKIALLNHLITKSRTNINEKIKYKETLMSNNKIRLSILPKYEDKIQKLEDYVIDRIEINNELLNERNEILNELKNKVRNDIQKLITYIFPITEVVINDDITTTIVMTTKTNQTGVGNSSSDSEVQEIIVSGKNTVATANVTGGGNKVSDPTTIAALADAKNTSYIRGRWVFHGSGISEMQYRIIAPSLPANGDYSAYLDWLSENKDGLSSAANEIVSSTVPAFRILAALTYSTQLVNLLSFYLNVRLPYKLAYGDFCKKLNEQQFKKKVSRLNTNVMYLAYTQHVKLSLLNENHTLENILAILNTKLSDLGSFGPVEITDAPLQRSIDSQILLDLETGTESESEDDNSLRLDWEAVSLTMHHDLSPPLPTLNQQQTASIGLMTSAVASVASFWRGWRN